MKSLLRMKNNIPASVLTACLFLPLFLTGCDGQRYEENEANEMIDSGKEQMEAWLKEHHPGAELICASNDIFQYPSGPSYLTGYVSGQYDWTGRTVDYTIDTTTGSVYLEADLEAFAEIARPWILEAVGLDDSAEITSYYVGLQLPYVYQGNGKSGSSSGVDLLQYARLPAEIAELLPVEDSGEEQEDNTSSENGEQEDILQRFSPDTVQAVEEYIRNPGSRDLLDVTLWAKVPDEKDLTVYDLPYLNHIREQFGVYLSSYAFWNSDEEASGMAWLTEYERREWIPFQGMMLHALVDMRGDKEDSSSTDGIARERYLYSIDTLQVEKTKDGLRFTCTADEFQPCFYVYAEKDSEIAGHGYTAKKLEEDAVENPLHWEASNVLDGSFVVLVTADGYPYYFSEPTELIAGELSQIGSN